MRIPALGALTNQRSQPAPDEDMLGGLILSRLDVVIAADATVGQVNSALESVGASIAGMRTGVPAITVAVPRQDDGAALQAIADTLGAQPVSGWSCCRRCRRSRFLHPHRPTRRKASGTCS